MKAAAATTTMIPNLSPCCTHRTIIQQQTVVGFNLLIEGFEGKHHSYYLLKLLVTWEELMGTNN
jgi:hypothetical protein